MKGESVLGKSIKAIYRTEVICLVHFQYREFEVSGGGTSFLYRAVSHRVQFTIQRLRLCVVMLTVIVKIIQRCHFGFLLILDGFLSFLLSQVVVRRLLHVLQLLPLIEFEPSIGPST